MNYETFLKTKTFAVPAAGITGKIPMFPYLFAFQQQIVLWSLRRGRAAIFADTGLGKSRMEIAWADYVCDWCGMGERAAVLICCPLAVAAQTVAEGVKIGVEVTLCRDASDVRPGVNITNYDRLHLFNPNRFVGIVLDESSILKSFTGSTKQSLIDFASEIPYRLAATATPAPNDHTELGNHAEFLSVMSRTEMLATFFCHDGGDTSVWRLKGHARSKFWQWVASWAICVTKPGDIGFPQEDSRYELPGIAWNLHELPAPEGYGSGQLIQSEAVSLNEQRAVRRGTLSARCDALAVTVAEKPDEPWIIWCDLNDEADMLCDLIPGAQQVQGADSNECKERKLAAFATGNLRVLVSKPSICGFGLNWQHCANMAFVGVSHSYETLYQAVRRCHRFGQIRPVNVHLFYSEPEAPILRSIKRKENEALTMQQEMVSAMKSGAAVDTSVRADRDRDEYKTGVVTGEGFTAYLGDCVDFLRKMESDSIHYVVFSPPFDSLYTYSNSNRDMGNVRSHEEFYEHFKFAVAELYRVLKPGRLLSFHCMTMPCFKEKDGFIGARDFRGELIRLFQDAGFYFHSEVCIWKDPVVAMQRTKAIGLLHKQLKKDATVSRQGFADYLVTMRKPGENTEPVTNTNESFPVGVWQNYASPVWMDINPSDTLQFRSVRENEDERHICPLQLTVIRRAVRLWTNPGDVVLSPFAGIGSEGVVSLESGRQFVGMELKESYYRQCVANLSVTANNRQTCLFDILEDEEGIK